MKDPLQGLDPAALALLQEVAADPNSSLLSYTPDKVARAAMESSSSIGPRTLGLSSAEVELTTVYRDEVTGLIKQWLRSFALSSELGKQLSTRCTAENTVCEPLEPSVAQARIGRFVGSMPPSVRREMSLGELGAGAMDQHTAARFTSLLARLRPSGFAAFYVGFQAMLQADWLGAEKVFRRALSAGGHRDNRSALLLATFTVQVLRSERIPAFAALEVGLRERPDLPQFALSMLANAAILGDSTMEKRAREALHRVTWGPGVREVLEEFQHKLWSRQSYVPGALLSGSRRVPPREDMEARCLDALQTA